MGKWLLGIVLILFGATAYSLIMAPKISENMGEDIRLALQNEGSRWADVTMDGHIATVTGEAPSNDAAREAVLIAQSITCSDCQTDKPWHRVLNGTQVSDVPESELTEIETTSLPVQSPYRFDVLKEPSGVVKLDGFVSTEEDRDALLLAAQNIFASTIENSTIQIADGEPNVNWLNVIQSGMENLSKMESGRFQLDDTSFLINGKAQSAEIRDAVNRFSQSASESYNGAANVNVPNLAADTVGQVTSQAICQLFFDDLNQGQKINFSTGRSEITGNDSFDLLAEIAAAANQCQIFRIQIDGYTDNTGDAEKNQQLSEQRANRVLAFLTQQGVDRSRMTATGHGESNPIGNNATAEGREKNRRTAFTLTQAQ